MKVIGLTGGIASGKSTVATILRKLGAPIFDADAVSRLAVNKGSEGLLQVIEAFGSSYLTPEGELDRPKVAQLVFKDKEALKKLEAIIHSYVRREAAKFLTQASQNTLKAVVLDVPLLIECGWYKQVDQVWLVAVDEKLQVERAIARSGMTEQEVKARIAAQMPLSEKKLYADLIIDNNGSLAATELIVKKEWQQVLKMGD